MTEARRDLQAEFDERAAIAEFDGGLSREEAERLATREIYDRLQLARTLSRRTE